ncbi:hypothetical protein P43SY_010279 [Pythium insidiosum]|uniref:Tectonic domain-containing protein n=1 Tax=Pythium insidiosum TaxID=114742 RepID=A0AAD5LD58_PYTIN|nr:hypothetical protein P43SY_010279 [Pythium insidiosum]
MARVLIAALSLLVPTAFCLRERAFTPINWTLVSSDAVKAAEKALVAPIGCSCTDNSCRFFDCSCSCDLTAGACDPLCCCDAECSAAQIEATKARGLCVDAKPASPSIEYCSADLTLEALAKGNVDPLVADSVLCVAVDNNENFGDYIARYKEEDMTVDNAFVKNPKPASFKAVLDAVATPDLPTRSVYWPGDVVKAFAKTAAQSASGPMLLLPVELEQFDSTTGKKAPLSPPFPAFYPRPVTATASGKITCQGALLSAAYKIHHDGSGRITSVTALLTIGDLTTSTDEPSLRLTQTFSVRFISDAAVPSRSLERGNLQHYDRSGNPGYQMHLPVRVGLLQTSDDGRSAISELMGGLPLPPLGDCLDSSKIGASALFGEDIRVSCSLSLTASNFESLCRQESSIVHPALAVNISHVASFGNADPFLVSEWIAIEYDAPTRSTATFQASADGVELTCANLVTSLHVELLVAPVGAANDAQDKIIAARATHGREMWHFWRRAGDATKTERFLLTTTVTFVTVRTTTLEQWIPPTPPIWFSIPNDVFYPFLLSSEASVSPLSFWAVLAVAGLSAFALP